MQRPTLTPGGHASDAAPFWLPATFGFAPFDHGWRKTLPGAGDVAFAPLAWPHAQTPSHAVADGRREPMDALLFVVHLQAETWGMPPSELVPVNLLAVLADSGGSLLVAYRPELGFNAEGWLGFAIALGGRSGVLVSHMVGVRPDARGGRAVGWHLKVLQACLAREAGHHGAIWTFDPMRGANARLNVEKLGATVSTLTLDKYGPLRSTLYGDVPSDRFTAEWDFDCPRTRARVAAVLAGEHRSPTVDDLAAFPEATVANVASLAAARSPRLWYRIPGDIDALSGGDPAAANRWRDEMRFVLGRLLDVARAEGDPARDGPAAVGATRTAGDYRVTGFVTGPPGPDRLNAYLLERRDRAATEEPSL